MAPSGSGLSGRKIGGLLLALSFLWVIGDGTAEADEPRKVAQRGDLVTTTGFGTNKTSACATAISMGRNLCAIRQFYDVTKVNCECEQDRIIGGWNCVAAVTCQE